MSSDARYRTTRWLRMRAAQLARAPLCAYCLLGVCQHARHIIRGRKDPDGNAAECFTMANTADHIEPHRGNSLLFWNHHNLQSLCATCHASMKQMIENAKGNKVQNDGYDA